MDDMAFQDIFNRLYGYLMESGVAMTSNRFRQLLQLIDDAIASASQEEGGTMNAVLDAAMDRMQVYFPAPQIAVAEVSPALMRGSIGYARAPAVGERRGSR
ncbi:MULTISPECIES: hypothetical protein [Marinobacter]|jgi:hypothetical protein|uniref:hypothetical protein n=1 Tax=Marinobacter TaxID=2742 RepID=UPI002356CEB5|nr:MULTISPECIES: hypothetical protein [Marinobacter]